MSSGNSDSGHSIVDNGVTTWAWMELESNSDHQSRLRNGSTSRRSIRRGEYLCLLMTSTTWAGR